VHVQWVRSGGVVTLEWRESDGPPVVPPNELGFGSRLLGPVLAGEVGQPAEVNYRPTGLVVRIRAPVDEP
jgi:two-component sensor histidine kinase